MFIRARKPLPVDDEGQVMILVAVAFPVLVGFLCLALLGGEAYAKHQQIQGAADMAAIVGAQALPCATTDTTCIQTAESVACTYAAKNGFGGCTPGATTGSNANVPPLSCSPYDFMDYGNGSSNSSCKPASAPSYYGFIEVQLRESLGTVPFFNVPLNLYAHAVARKGIASPHGYALVALGSQGISMTNSNETVLEGAAWSNGNITGNSDNIACDGGWFASGTVSGVSTSSGSSITYSPLGCGSGSGTPLTAQNQPPIQDPYSGSVPPAAPVWSGSTCPECARNGYWYDLNGGTWGQGGTPSGAAPPTASPGPTPTPCPPKTPGCGPKPGPGPGPGPGPACGKNSPEGCGCTQSIEMFPGVYTTVPGGTGTANSISCVYMNPGVYTFTAPVDPSLNATKEHIGILCVFGSPSCDSKDNNKQCDNAKFTDGSDGGDAYFYQCAPWGFWDSSSFGGTRPPGLPTTPPTWYNASTNSWTNVPLNGVTLYFPSNSQNLALTTHPGTSTLSLLGAPNPCPGTGSTFTSGQAVQFPQGDASALYTYPSTSLVYQHGLTSAQTFSGSSSSFSLVYSNDDITQLGECGLPYVEWPSAMPAPQHVNFLVYESGGMNNLFYGTDDVDWQGVFYAPQGVLSFTGKTGDEGSSGAEGIPWLVGQVVVDHASFYGTSSVQIAYLPCTPGSLECLAGNALQLVE